MRRKEKITTGECYHIFNRGVEKRNIFNQKADYERFVKSLEFFNTESSIEMRSEGKNPPESADRLVEVIAYCINSNHFHLLLKENKENGIVTFMKKVCTGYSMYFNKKNKRSGVLFQGRFKSVHVDSNDLLLYISAYVNCNSQIHNIENSESYVWCSFPEYLGNGSEKCQKEIILDQFSNVKEYKKFCLEKVEGMKDRKKFDATAALLEK